MVDAARMCALVEAGDPGGAATAAIEALGRDVLGYLRALHDPDDAEDVFQRWAEDVWRGIAELRHAGALRAWAYRLAWRASARFRRDAWHRRRTRLGTSAASRLAASVSRSAPGGGRDERLEILGEALDPEERTLLLLHLDLELSWDEIAAVLGEGASARARERLRKRYQRLKVRLGALARRKGLID